MSEFVGGVGPLCSAREVAVAVVIVGLASLSGCGGGSSEGLCAVDHDIDGRPSPTAAAHAFFEAVHAEDFTSACTLVAPNFSLARSDFDSLASRYAGHQVEVLEQDRVAPDTASLLVTAEDAEVMTVNAVQDDRGEWLVLAGTPHNTSGTDPPSSAS